MGATARPASLNGLQATALQVVRQHFGDHTEVICAALVRYPRRTLKELLGDTDIAVGQLRNCLLILLQHNLVTAAIDSSKQRSAGQVLYSFSQEAAALRLRFPKFVAHISKILGEKDSLLGERILEAVLENGRSSWIMIWGQIKSMCEADGCPEERVQKVGDILVKSKYIVRVIPVSERVEPVVHEYTAPKKATAAGKRKAAQDAEDRESKARKMDMGCMIANAVKDESEGMTESITNQVFLFRYLSTYSHIRPLNVYHTTRVPPLDLPLASSLSHALALSLSPTPLWPPLLFSPYIHTN